MFALLCIAMIDSDDNEETAEKKITEDHFTWCRGAQ